MLRSNKKSPETREEKGLHNFVSQGSDAYACSNCRKLFLGANGLTAINNSIVGQKKCPAFDKTK